MASPSGTSNRPRRSVCKPTYGDHEYSFLDGLDIDITPDEEEDEYVPERLGSQSVESEEDSDDDVPLASLVQSINTGSPSSDSDDEPLVRLVAQSSSVPGSTKRKPKKTLMAKGRGTSEQLVRPGEDIALTKWFDNKPIILASTEIGINPESTCRRWDSKNKKYVDVQRPAVVSNYNKYMGGIDLADRMIGHYRSGSKTNKWTVRTIFHFLDLSVSNSWIQYREDQLELGTPKKDIMDMLEFKMTIAGKLIYAGSEPNENSENSEEEIEMKKKYSPMPPKERRFSQSKHMPEVCPEKNAHRCRNVGCSKKTKVKCTYCNVFLCLTAERNCYKVFHSYT